MADAQTTISGNLAGDPELRFTQTGRPVVNFTVAENRRKRDAGGEWADAESLFMRCTAWGDLAENIAGSLSKGHRVTVSGRLEPRSFEHDGQRRHVIELVADEVAASLRFATVKVIRTVRELAPDAVPGTWADVPATAEPAF